MTFITSSISSDFTITDSTLKLHNDTAAESLNHGDVLSTILFEKHSNGNDTIKIYNTSGDDSGGHDYHSSDLRVSTRPRAGNLTDRFTIIGHSGEVGIGTTSPKALFDVTATNNPTILLNSRDAAHAAGDKIGSLLFYNNEDSSGETGSRVGAGVRFVATDAYGRGNLELTSGTSDPMGSYNAAEV